MLAGTVGEVFLAFLWRSVVRFRLVETGIPVRRETSFRIRRIEFREWGLFSFRFRFRISPFRLGFRFRFRISPFRFRLGFRFRFRISPFRFRFRFRFRISSFRLCWRVR